MRWSLKLGEIRGVKIYLHWTFLILVGWIFMLYLGQGQGMGMALRGVGFILAVFGCVVLHELGHAVMAQHYQIRTRDITLLPVGGVARLERMPREPLQDNCSTLPLVREGRLVGMITQENIAEWVMLNTALHHAHLFSQGARS